MKNKMNLVMVGMMVLGTGVSPVANASSMGSVLLDYGLPCAVSIGLSAALVKNDGAMIGTAICAGVGTATYLNKKPVDSVALSAEVDRAVSERDMKITAETDAKIKNTEDNVGAKQEENLKMLREILADRLLKMEEDVRADVDRKISEGNFMPDLEKRLNQKIKEEVILEGRARNREIKNEVVDEALRELTSKKYGIPDSAESKE